MKTPTMAMAPHIFPFLFFFQLLLCPHSFALNITTILDQFPDFSTFNDLLTRTQVAAEINRRQSAATILAVQNGAFPPIYDEPNDVLKKILSVHVILDYFDGDRLKNLPGRTAILATLFQTSGEASGLNGFLSATGSRDGQVGFSSALPGSPLSSYFVRVVAALPFDVVVLQVSDVIVPPGIITVPPRRSNASKSHSTVPDPAPAPLPSPAPAPAPLPSPTPGPLPSPAPRPLPLPPPAPAKAPAVPPTWSPFGLPPSGSPSSPPAKAPTMPRRRPWISMPARGSAPSSMIWEPSTEAPSQRPRKISPADEEATNVVPPRRRRTPVEMAPASGGQAANDGPSPSTSTDSAPGPNGGFALTSEGLVLVPSAIVTIGATLVGALGRVMV